MKPTTVAIMVSSGLCYQFKCQQRKGLYDPRSDGEISNGGSLPLYTQIQGFLSANASARNSLNNDNIGFSSPQKENPLSRRV